MRSIVKAFATGAMVVPVVLGGAGAAFADGSGYGQGSCYDRCHDNGRDYDNGHRYDNGRDYDNDYGKGRGDGPAYVKIMNSATVWGGMESKTVSGFREDGTAFFYKTHKVAGPKGAFSHKVGARS